MECQYPLITPGDRAQILLGDRGREARVRVAERGHGDAGAEVEVAAAAGVPDLAALAALEDDRRLAVVRAVGSVECAGTGVEPDFAADYPSQFEFEVFCRAECV